MWTRLPPATPKLIRKQNGNTDIVAEQIIGFKAGAATWIPRRLDQHAHLTASMRKMRRRHRLQDTAAILKLVRSVRVTLIGRTTPNPDPTYTFRNTFDGGPYQVGTCHSGN